MIQIQIQTTKWRLTAICLCTIFGTLQPPIKATTQGSLQLISVPGEPIWTDFQWSIDGKLLIFDASSGPGANDIVQVAYDVTTQTASQTALNQARPSTLNLSTDEITKFSPFIDPTSKQPLAFLSPDKKYAVYPSSVGKLDETSLVTFYSVRLANRATKQVVDTTLSVLHPPGSFNVIWNRTSTAFVVLSEVYEIGTPTLVGYISGFDKQLANLKIATQADQLIVNGQNYVPGGVVPFPGGSPDPGSIVFAISDSTTLRHILTTVSCGGSVLSDQPSCPVRIRLAVYDFDNPNQSQVFTQINGDLMGSASFSAESEQVLWAVTDQGLVQLDTRSGKLAVIDSRLTTDWARYANFSPDRRWLAVINVDDQYGTLHLYVAKLPTIPS